MDRERELDELLRRFSKMKMIERVCGMHLIRNWHLDLMQENMKIFILCACVLHKFAIL